MRLATKYASSFLLGIASLLFLCLSFQAQGVSAAPVAGLSDITSSENIHSLEQRTKPSLPTTRAEVEGWINDNPFKKKKKEGFFFTGFDSVAGQINARDAWRKSKDKAKSEGLVTIDDVWAPKLKGNIFDLGFWNDEKDAATKAKKFDQWTKWASSVYAEHAGKYSPGKKVWLLMPKAADRKALATSVFTKEEFPQLKDEGSTIEFWKWPDVKKDIPNKPTHPDTWWKSGDATPATRP